MSVLEGKVSERKSRLFSTACCWSIFPSIQNEDLRTIIALGERHADGLATHSEVWESANCVTAGFSEHDPISMMVFNTIADMSERLDPWYAVKDTVERRLSGEINPSIQCRLIRDLFGNPFRPSSFNPSWRTSTVTSLAQSVYDDRQLPSGLFDNQRLGILADALEDAGCDNADILGHLRGGGEHVRGCHVIDLILGKE